MQPKESIYVCLRLLIDPKAFNLNKPENLKKISFSVTYTTFRIKKKGGSIIPKRKYTESKQKFKRNPARDEKGLIALDSDPFWLYKYSKDDEEIVIDTSGRYGKATFTIDYNGTKFPKDGIKADWKLDSENSVTRYELSLTKGVNSTKPNTQKKANINPYPFIIAKSKNALFAEDSHHSKGKKLPAKFSTRFGTLYTMSKEELLKELLNLMAWGAMGKNEVVAKDLATKFVNNKNYSMGNTYTHPTLVDTIRNSEEFKNYIKNTSTDIRDFIKKNNFKIVPNELLVKTEIDRLYFNGGKYYQNYWGTGLGITLHQISYVEIELNNVIHQAGKPDKLITTFVLYDTFGLDTLDVDKYGLLDDLSEGAWDTFRKRDIRGKGISTGLGWGFNCWWALQFHHDCVPVLVKLRIDNVEISL